MVDFNVLHLRDLGASNERDINQLLINGLVETCQLQMGMTVLDSGAEIVTTGRNDDVNFFERG